MYICIYVYYYLKEFDSGPMQLVSLACYRNPPCQAPAAKSLSLSLFPIYLSIYMYIDVCVCILLLVFTILLLLKTVK